MAKIVMDARARSVSMVADLQVDFEALGQATTIDAVKAAIPSTIALKSDFADTFAAHVADFQGQHPDLCIDKVPIVVIYGEQKVGKSSLLNALFDVGFAAADDIDRTTCGIDMVLCAVHDGAAKHALLVLDVEGYGSLDRHDQIISAIPATLPDEAHDAAQDALSLYATRLTAFALALANAAMAVTVTSGVDASKVLSGNAGLAAIANDNIRIDCFCILNKCSPGVMKKQARTKDLMQSQFEKFLPRNMLVHTHLVPFIADEADRAADAHVAELRAAIFECLGLRHGNIASRFCARVRSINHGFAMQLSDLAKQINDPSSLERAQSVLFPGAMEEMLRNKYQDQFGAIWAHVREDAPPVPRNIVDESASKAIAAFSGGNHVMKLFFKELVVKDADKYARRVQYQVRQL
ncbi:hypothetical protein AMAG_11018 [Allomyces macrogynus ATCC 38327]|uniref:Guanylate-binding protein N-terminal domain-containing protein n=1 Tax=Allomyces macrogynus (strain ATCC 38327) TaxID=578462 RepID=A0A0L0SSA2_ALLM3|nr:hypothetical protein AMAG_11018 [Allomyces macrogynus ATCC 38327]|eukprot:KNE65382.1 hypothetical protein AMAG_11018 [Allomyces macrogynus ATCC 38327]